MQSRMRFRRYGIMCKGELWVSSSEVMVISTISRESISSTAVRMDRQIISITLAKQPTEIMGRCSTLAVDRLLVMGISIRVAICMSAMGKSITGAEMCSLDRMGSVGMEIWMMGISETSSRTMDSDCRPLTPLADRLCRKQST